jgi:formate hydrogenlyase subunit 3/multisubunit Na+/H+ antiporter MnhD subunit
MLNWDFETMRLLIAVLLFIISVAGMYGFLYYQPQLDSSLGMPFILLGIAAIIVFSWAGLFQRSLITYAIFSTIIQAAYFVLDTGSVLVGGKSIMFAFLQALNFTIAGGLFMIVFARLYASLGKDDLVDYAGLYEKNNFLVFLMCLSCLSLGGMVGFNIFVGEFLLYSFLFAIHPALAIAAIFAGLVCFLFYFRICYTLMVRKSQMSIPLPLPIKIVAAVLSGLVVGLGIMPQVLLKILEMIA